jgi:hypothetical protein
MNIALPYPMQPKPANRIGELLPGSAAGQIHAQQGATGVSATGSSRPKRK